jgi:hypothetical protein
MRSKYEAFVDMQWQGEKLMFSEKILSQCLFVHVGFVADKSEMRPEFLWILHYSAVTGYFQQWLTLLCTFHRCYTIFASLKQTLISALFSRHIMYQLPVQSGPYYKHYMTNTSSPSEFFLLLTIAQDNQLSRYSSENTIFFCHLCAMTPGYSAKLKSLQTYVLVNQASGNNSSVTARSFQNGCFSSNINMSTTFNHIKYGKTESTLLSSAPRLPKERSFFVEGSQALLVCTCGNSNL